MSQENFVLGCKTFQSYVNLRDPLEFRLDCTEAQFSFILIYMISIIAPGFWSVKVNRLKEMIIILVLSLKLPLFNIEFRVVATLFVLGSTTWSAANNIHTISQGGCGRDSSTIAVKIAFFSSCGFRIFEYCLWFFHKGHKYHFPHMADWFSDISRLHCFELLHLTFA